ncbi:ribbon-helix-helix protein, CopG family [Vermiculatibacterium agrestimuris]|uniref:ribbon-helix-helix protein, CopG family n=1 Tax=Vermiculatibacterium agrestimuris TaxID=2941519 RepID=UPI00203B50D5|nr:ribbon-helix-helix protein, CopG family [Vermiculatibacterium agrestimuris]
MERDTIRLSKRGDDGYKVISVRLKEPTLKRIDEAAGKTNRSRNEIINIILDHGVDILEIEE